MFHPGVAGHLLTDSLLVPGLVRVDGDSVVFSGATQQTLVGTNVAFTPVCLSVVAHADL